MGDKEQGAFIGNDSSLKKKKKKKRGKWTDGELKKKFMLLTKLRDPGTVSHTAKQSISRRFLSAKKKNSKNLNKNLNFIRL